MKSIKHTLRGSLAALLTLGALHSVASTNLTEGAIAPDFSVQTLDGRNLSLSDFKGKKPVYLKFWATWCSYCKAEMPHLQSVFDKHGQAIEVLSVNVGINDSIHNIEQLFSHNNYTIPTVFDKDGSLTSRYEIVGTPHHVLIDQDGRIAYRTFLATDQLDTIINQWSQQTPKNSAANKE